MEGMGFLSPKDPAKTGSAQIHPSAGHTPQASFPVISAWHLPPVPSPNLGAWVGLAGRENARQLEEKTASRWRSVRHSVSLKLHK